MVNSTEYKNKYIQEKYDRINLTVKKGLKQQIAARAAELGKSTNSYLNDLIEFDLKNPAARTQATGESPAGKKDMDVFLL